ncbi:MAG: trypsin-like peptidase domain-containing protein [Selenomonadaceae bacterium]|nr:trypsin-like peptidase domain-containing protein [Selenomonadaceae bacterium]
MKKSPFTFPIGRGKAALLSAVLSIPLVFSGCGIIGGGGGGENGGGEKPPVIEEPQKPNIEQIVEKVGPSVVNIVADGSTVIKRGSGVLFSEEGYILTNDHVVRESNSLEVHLSDKRTLKAKRIGTDSRMDLAVIKVEETNLKPAELGDSGKMKIGTDVIAIGNAKGVENSATKGIISNLDIDVDDGTNITRCLQTDAPVNPGNSGGALVNMQGEVIGINTMSRTDAESMHYAIPINDAHKIARQLIDKGYISYPYLGVNAVNEKNQNGTIVIRVLGVMPDSPAAKKGFHENDIIKQINGVEVRTVSKLREQLNLSGIGSMVSVYIRRGNQEGTIQVQLEELPKGYYTIDWS